ncbi:MAG: hypothetical protein AAFV95_15345 [Bacteroidota bacterium]
MMAKHRILLLLLLWGTSLGLTAQDYQNEYGTDHRDVYYRLGLTGGWGSTYGFGIELSVLLLEQFDLNAGAGVSFNGFKYGVGGRVYLLKDNFISPYLGLNYVRSTGLPEIEITLDGIVGFYNILADETANVKGGLAIEFGWTRLLTTVGYGFAFGDYDAVPTDGYINDEHQRFANWMAVGGLELSGTLLFRFGRRQTL